MSIQNTKIRNEEKDNVDAFGNWLKVRTTAVFDNVREYFKQIHIQQERDKYNRSRTPTMKAHQQDILNLEEKHRLGLYHLMD
jgi:cystathionine beta-lyase/cystathionine gamma-synthase